MSLKARIEAVIYAAEEPVSLAQLASLFRDDALAHRAARLAPQADDAFPTEAEAEAVADDILPAEEPSIHREREAPSADRGGPAASEPAAQNSADAEVATPDFAGQPQPIPEPPGSATNLAPSGEREAPSADREGPEALAEAEKKAARALDREIRDEVRLVIDELIADYNSPDRGLEIREVAGGFRIGTRPEVHDAVRGFIKTLKPPLKLSLQALETLAVIAYKQPITAPEIGEIRGVDSGGVLGSLIARKLITTAGRKQVIGRPILYKTTREFLLRFGLKDLNELPSIEEFEKMAADLEEETSSPDAEGDSPSAQDLPFAPNEVSETEPPSPPHPEGDPPPAQDPINDPQPEVPEPPIGEPPAEPEPDPTSAHSAETRVSPNAADHSPSAEDPAPTTEIDAAVEEHQP